MSSDKDFLTYNQQMRRLRDNKKIGCSGPTAKRLLVRAGYFNLINGYKTPFVSGTDPEGNHIYIKGTTINQLYAVKAFDENLRSFLLKYITQVEEEVRSLTSYKFDECNNNGSILWYSTDAFSPRVSLQKKMDTISSAYNEITRSRLDYVKFYKDNHSRIPTWIMLKAVGFSTFIDVLQFSKQDVTHSICKLYSLYDDIGKPNVKLLIGSLHWMRKVRNSCAHNERVYCLTRDKNKNDQHSGRIIESYISSLGPGYRRDLSQHIFDLLIYFKYYLPKNEYKRFILDLKEMLTDLQSKIHPQAFDYIRGQMGIKKLSDLDLLLSLPKDDINFNKYDTLP